VGKAEIHPPDAILIRHVGEAFVEPTVFGRIERSLVANKSGEYRQVYALYLSLGRKVRPGQGERHQRIELDMRNALDWFRAQVAGLEEELEKEDDDETHP